MNTSRKDVEVIGLVGLAHSTSHFFHLILAPLFPWLKTEFALSYAELGFLMTVFFVVSTIVQASAGFWVDHSGARPVLFTGIGLLALSAFILGMAPHYWVLILGAAIAGMGNGVFHPSDYTLLNQLIAPKNLGHAYSVHGVTGYLGWASAPIFLVGLTTLFDWRVALFSASALALSVLVLLWIRGEVLLYPLKEAVHTDAQQTQQIQPATFAFLKLPSIWMCWGFFFLTAIALGGIQSFSPSAVQAIYQVPLSVTTTAYTTFMLASAGGMILGGFVASRVGKPDLVIAMAFLLSGLTAVVIGLGVFSSVMIPVLFAFMGLGAGVAGPSRDLMIRSATPKGATGRVYGMVYSGLDTGMALGPLMFGLLMDAKLPPLIFFGIAAFQIAAIFTAVRLSGNTRAQTAAA
jgi:MFS family permease